MAYESLKTKSIIAGIDLSAKQHTFVRVDSSGTLNAPTAGGNAIGVVQDKPAAGDPGAVCFPGDITKVVAGAQILAGAEIMTTSAGKAVTVTSGSFVLGIALMAASGDGSVISILFQPKGSKL